MNQNEITKAAIVIGYEYLTSSPSDMYHIYYFPTNITEQELINEILSLVPHYSELVYPTVWPPHIRKNYVVAAIENFQPHCQEGTQCNMFCQNYKKGCVLNAIE